MICSTRCSRGSSRCRSTATTWCSPGPAPARRASSCTASPTCCRVRRVAAERIIALAFNRSAAVELRRRLIALVGDDARGVTVLTYHGMALRLTGTSLAAADRRGGAVDFGRLLQDAIDLLEGKSDAFSSDADERRDTLMQGYEYIFVDEYQDIDEQQYSLVSALAGRRLNDPEAKLSIMAVGDDDQNIYSFKGASVEFIRRFQADYEGTVTYLVENFRSTQNIIAAANHVIQRASDRMKIDHPIRIDSRRATDAPGGRWAVLDSEHHGKVRLVTAPADPNRQAQVVFSEIARIRRSDAEVSLGDIAILARTHRSLEPLRALCDVEGLRYEVLSRDGAGAQLPLMQSREGWKTADLLRARRSALVSVAAIRRWIGRQAQARTTEHLLARHRGCRRRVRGLGSGAETPRCRSAGRAVRGGQRCPAQRSCFGTEADDRARREGTGVSARHRHGLRRLALERRGREALALCGHDTCQGDLDLDACRGRSQPLLRRSGNRRSRGRYAAFATTRAPARHRPTLSKPWASRC